MTQSPNDPMQLARNLASLAERYRNQENLSIWEMLKQTGHFASKGKVSLESVREALSGNEHYQREWMGYSEDKRSDSGWYIMRQGETYEVGRLLTEGGHADVRIHPSMIDACADFVVSEAFQIASS